MYVKIVPLELEPDNTFLDIYECTEVNAHETLVDVEIIMQTAAGEKKVRIQKELRPAVYVMNEQGHTIDKVVFE